jgi:hypothetical protein
MNILHLTNFNDYYIYIIKYLIYYINIAKNKIKKYINNKDIESKNKKVRKR